MNEPVLLYDTILSCNISFWITDQGFCSEWASVSFVICTYFFKLHFCSVSPACRKVCNYSSISHENTACTQRKTSILWCMEPTRKVPAKMYTHVNKQSCTDLHQLSPSTFFSNVLPATTLSKARAEPLLNAPL